MSPADLELLASQQIATESELSALRARLVKMERDLLIARGDFAAADASLIAALGAETIGEGDAKATKSARVKREALDESVRAFESGISVLGSRVSDAEARKAVLASKSKEATRALAQAMSIDAVEVARAAFEFACEALEHAHQLLTTANGGEENTGTNYSDFWRLSESLERHKIKATGGLVYPGSLSGMDGGLSLPELLALVPAAKAAA